MSAPTPYTPPDGHILIEADGHIMPTKSDGWEIANALYELRPVRQPDPRGVTVDLAELSDTADRCEVRVTSVGEMRGRTDLDQWEYADPWHGGWQPAIGPNGPTVQVPDDLPVIVRRVS